MLKNVNYGNGMAGGELQAGSLMFVVLFQSSSSLQHASGETKPVLQFDVLDEGMLCELRSMAATLLAWPGLAA